MKRTASILAIVALGLPACMQAQQAPTYKIEDSMRVAQLINQGTALRRVDMDSARGVFWQADSLALATNYLRGHSAALSHLGITYGMQGDYAEALKLFGQSLAVAERYHIVPMVTAGWNNLAITYRKLGDYNKSFDYFRKVVAVEDSLGNQLEVAKLYFSIGVLHDMMEDQETAMEYTTRARDMALEFQDTALYYMAVNSLGVISHKNDDMAKAEEYYRLYLEGCLLQDDNPQATGTAYSNLANTLVNLNRATEAMPLLDSAMDFAQRFNYRELRCIVWHNYAMSYEQVGRLDLAMQAADSTIALAHELGSLVRLFEGHEVRHRIWKAKRQYDKALEDYKVHAQLRDSLFRLNKEQEFQQQQARFDVYTKDRQIDEQQQQLDKSLVTIRRNQLLLFALGACLVLAVVLALALRWRVLQRRRSEALLQEKNNMISAQKREIENTNKELEYRMLRVQINPHFIFNSLGALQNFITQDNRKAALSYLGKFSNLLRRVLESSFNHTVTLAEEISLLDTYTRLEGLRFEGAFETTFDIDPELNTDSVEVPIMVLQPFVENAILHGLVNKPNPPRKLRLSFKTAEGMLVCQVEDNGIGRVAAAKVKQGKLKTQRSRGLEVATQRIINLEGAPPANQAIVVTDLLDAYQQPAGTCVTVTLPLLYRL